MSVALDQSTRAIHGLFAGRGAFGSQLPQERDPRVVLADALAELSPEQRDVILLHSLQELDWEEVARHMAKSVHALQVLWAGALKELRSHIEARV